MPLAFNSISHGEIAFGFFNLETDLLLLDTYFMFASDFCNHVAVMADARPGEDFRMGWEVYTLKEEQIGSLSGAIHGADMRGFIGDVYRRFPLPEDMNSLAQNPDGDRTQSIIREIIERYEKAGQVSVVVDATGSTVELGDYLFSREEFHELLRYILRGGYPSWKAGVKPGYVVRMKGLVDASGHPLFDGFSDSI